MCMYYHPIARTDTITQISSEQSHQGFTRYAIGQFHPLPCVPPLTRKREESQPENGLTV